MTEPQSPNPAPHLRLTTSAEGEGVVAGPTTSTGATGRPSAGDPCAGAQEHGSAQTPARGTPMGARAGEGTVLAPASALELWTPSDPVRPAQWVKFASGVLATALFALWMVHAWKTPMTRLVGAVFAAVSAYLTYRMVRDDMEKRRGRQVRLLSGALYVTARDGTHVIPLDQVLLAQWRSDMEAASGLWFFDREKKVLAHLTTEFLANEIQARSLLDWVAARFPLPFEVRWT